MSDDAVRPDDPSFSIDSVLEYLRRWFHVPAVLLVVVFMFAVRILSRDNFVRNGEVYFTGNDPWYHFRMVEYAVSHTLQLQPFEIWTGFSYGTNSGQFGTLFDQLIATAAMVVGLGDPTTNQVALTVLYAPAVFGALLAIPTYLIGRRISGRVGGLFGAIILALLPGLFLQRGLVGSADHNVAEPLFQSFAVLGFLTAIYVAEQERPIWEQFLERDYVGLKNVLGWSVLAGAATAFYLWMWPPGILIVGFFGVFLLLQLTSDFYTGTSPDHIAIPGAIAMGTTGLLMLLPIGEFVFRATGFTLLQIALPFGVAIGAGFLSFLGRYWERQSYDTSYYPYAVASILVAGTALFAVLLPDIFSYIYSNFLRIVGFTTGAGARTVGEAQPFPSSRASQLALSGWKVIFLQYGSAFYTALIAAVWMLLKPHLKSRKQINVGLSVAFIGITTLFIMAPAVPRAIGGIFLLSGDLTGLFIVSALIAALLVSEDYPAQHTLIIVWSGFILSAAFTQVRFNYYLVVPVAVLNAYALKEVFTIFGIDRSSFEVPYVEWSNVMIVATVLILVLAPLVAPITFTNQRNQEIPMRTAWEVGDSTGPGAVTAWDEVLSWMPGNTPSEGDYGDTNNDNQMEYYGTYKTPPDGDYNYPAGSYGVMSWWDYGHWITVLGERIPNANPFQQNAGTAANYLLAPNETTANDVLDGIDEDDAKTRYVAVDWKMVAPQSKFGAPTVFYSNNESLARGDMIMGEIYNPQAQNWITLKSQRYYESQMVRLYRYHGSAKQAQPIVVDFEYREYEGVSQPIPTLNGTQRFRSMSAAREFAEQDGTAVVGGFSDVPSEDVDALEHYRLVKASGKNLAPGQYLQNAEFNFGNHPTWVKLFERVPGATIQGTAPPNTTVEARVEMAIQFPDQPGTFNYTQYAETGPDGEFEMTLPYSTTGYENWGPENGYTNVSVQATGPYTFSATKFNQTSFNVTQWEETQAVSEAAVIGEDSDTITVNLEKKSEQSLGTPPDQSSNNNSTSTNNQTALGDPIQDPSSDDDETVTEESQPALQDEPTAKVEPAD